ncbi:MAG: T9SS type A sorting domain-containing protein [Bacteroidota bacterium]
MLRSDDRGETWSEPEAITIQNGYIQNIGVLGDTITIVGYLAPIDYDWIISSTDGGVSWTQTELPFYTNDPRVALSNGWLHLAYGYFIQGCSIEQLYRRSYDLGQTWSDSVMLSTCDNRGGGTPAIAATPEGGVYITWTDSKYGCAGFGGCGILFRKSTDNGASWFDEHILTDNHWGNVSDVSANGETVLVTWFRASILLHVETRISTDDGISWCPVVDLTPSIPQTGRAVYPRNSIARSGVIVAWDQRDTTAVPFNVVIRVGSLAVSVAEPAYESPLAFQFLDAYPNPFNSSTTISYSLSTGADVRLSIFNVLGEAVDAVVNEFQSAGLHQVAWDANGFGSGVYFYRLESRGLIAVGKILLLR